MVTVNTIAQIDGLPTPPNGPTVILSILYDEDGLESILNRSFFSNAGFPEIKSKLVRH